MYGNATTIAIRRLAYALSHKAPCNQSVELARELVAAYDAIPSELIMYTDDPKRHWIAFPRRLPPV